jgi:short-subunit dehydrogenase
MSQSVVITGASSGIGRAIALEYSRPHATLGLIGRSTERLEEVATECRKLGASVTIGVVDVRDRPGLARWLTAFDDNHPIDLLVANAGVLVRMVPGDIEPADDAYALMASVAAFTPLPHSPSYSSSKAAVLNYGLSLRPVMGAHGVRVSVICSGFVETPMIADIKGPKPFNMSAENAARLIRRGLDKNRGLIAFPFLFAAMSRIDGLLPESIRRWMNPDLRAIVRRG